MSSSKDMHSRNDAGKRRMGRPSLQYIDNIKNWARTSLEENIRLTGDRTPWHERSCAAGRVTSGLTTPTKATPDRTISGSYDWLRLGQGATIRQCLIISPAAVAYRDGSLIVVALSRTIGEYR